MFDFRQSVEKSSYPHQRESMTLTLDTRWRGYDEVSRTSRKNII